MLLIHCHHDVLAEKSDDPQERIAYIKARKPKDEVETRLRLLKVAPDDAEKKWDALNAEWQTKRDALDAEWNKKRGALNAEWSKKRDALNDEWSKKQDAWHAKWCGCAEWNGQEIIFPNKGQED